MKSRQLSMARMMVCGLTLLGSMSLACDEQVEAIGSAEMGIVIGRYLQNSDLCPAAPTEAMTAVDRLGPTTAQAACEDVPAGTLCAYDVRTANGAYSGWAGYVCNCREGAEGLWHNIGSTNPDVLCPDEPPVAGTACVGGPCPYYPNVQASCLGGVWTFEEMPTYYCDLLGVTVPER